MTVPDPEELARALERGEIVPYFQPLVALRTGALTGFEVLARWSSPIHGPVSPDCFIRLAETSGQIDALTDSVLRQACIAANGWRAPTQLSVNLSAVQLQDRGLPDRLCAIAESAVFPFERLVFEITEAALVTDPELARQIMGDLKSLGAQLALDDFGIGYSSLRQLQMLPFDKLKLDASFVRAMTSQRESRKIVAAVIGLGQSLGLTTVAEGVESRIQADLLNCLGCEIGQGWLFGRAVPTQDAAALLAQWPDRPPPPRPLARIAKEVATRLEALPSQSLAHLQALYKGAPVGLGFFDTGMRYVTLNERLAEMHGCSIADHIGRSISELFPQLYEKVSPYLHRALAGEPVTGFMVDRCIEGDPRKFMLLGSYQPVFDVGGELMGVSIAVVDITVQHAAGLGAAGSGEARAAPDARLTPRQRDVLSMLVEGRSAKEIARQMGLGVGTVKAHLSAIYAALGARNRIEAITRAGLLRSPRVDAPAWC